MKVYIVATYLTNEFVIDSIWSSFSKALKRIDLLNAAGVSEYDWFDYELDKAPEDDVGFLATTF